MAQGLFTEYELQKYKLELEQEDVFKAFLTLRHTITFSDLMRQLILHARSTITENLHLAVLSNLIVLGTVKSVVSDAKRRLAIVVR